MAKSFDHFSDLNIDEDMPVTRSHEQASQRGKGPRRGRDARFEPLARSSSRQADVGQPASAAESHQSSTIETLTKKNEYFAIEFNPAAVRVPSPSLERSRAWCSCQSFEDGEVCYHTEWLAAWLNYFFPTDPSADHPQNDRSLWELLSSNENSLSDLNAKLNEVASHSRDANPYNERRSYLILDILSMFDEDTDSGAQGRIVAPLNLSDCWRKDSLPDTIYNMAMTNSGVFVALLKTVPQEDCAIEFLSRQERAARLHLDDLDNVQHLPPGQHVNVVVDCNRALRNIVHEIEIDLRIRQPTMHHIGLHFTAFVLRLVEEVCRRNKDLRSGDRARTRDPKHNFYSFVIGNPPQTADESYWMTELFGLDALERLPVHYWNSHDGMLTGLRDRVQQYSNNVPSDRGSRRYLDKVNSLIPLATQSTVLPQASSSGGSAH